MTTMKVVWLHNLPPLGLVCHYSSPGKRVCLAQHYHRPSEPSQQANVGSYNVVLLKDGEPWYQLTCFYESMPRSVNFNLYLPTHFLQQGSAILAIDYFCMACGLRIVCTFLILKKIIKRKIVFVTLSWYMKFKFQYPWVKSSWKTVTLFNLHVIYGNCHATATELSSFQENLPPQKPKIFIVWPFREKVCLLLV